MTDLNAALNALIAVPQLRGPRVRLRAPRDEDAPALFALFSDTLVMRYGHRPIMAALSEAEGRVVEMQEAFVRREMIQWIVAGRDDRAIGTCNLHGFNARQRRARLGYTLRSDLWKRGLARESTGLVIDWAFRALALHCIDADTDPRNSASSNLLLRLGFVAEIPRSASCDDSLSDVPQAFVLSASHWQNATGF